MAFKYKKENKMKVNELMFKVRQLYKDMNEKSFTEPDADVTKKVVKLYQSLTEENTMINIKNLLKFLSYFPDLKAVEDKDQYKIIEAQNYFYKMALVCLVRKANEKIFKEEESFSEIVGSDLPDMNKVKKGTVLIRDEDRNIFCITQEMKGNKMDSDKIFYACEFSHDGLLFSDVKEIHFNDCEIFLKVGSL